MKAPTSPVNPKISAPAVATLSQYPTRPRQCPALCNPKPGSRLLPEASCLSQAGENGAENRCGELEPLVGLCYRAPAPGDVPAWVAAHRGHLPSCLQALWEGFDLNFFLCLGMGDAPGSLYAHGEPCSGPGTPKIHPFRMLIRDHCSPPHGSGCRGKGEDMSHPSGQTGVPAGCLPQQWDPDLPPLTQQHPAQRKAPRGGRRARRAGRG